jgi:hypothetical protein
MMSTTRATEFVQYHNGNTVVTLLEDGTKVREWQGDAQPNHPESIDIKLTDYCDLGCQFCFPPDTNVLTPSGNKRISDIESGDTVYSFNEKTMTFEQDEVENIMQREYDGDLIVLEMENGDSLRLTPNHEVWTNNRGWLQAKDILPDDDLNNIF